MLMRGWYGATGMQIETSEVARRPAAASASYFPHNCRLQACTRRSDVLFTCRFCVNAPFAEKNNNSSSYQHCSSLGSCQVQTHTGKTRSHLLVQQVTALALGMSEDGNATCLVMSSHVSVKETHTCLSLRGAQ